MSSWLSVAGVVRSIPSSVVKIDVANSETAAARDGEAVNRPVLDVQVGDNRINRVLDHNKVVGPVGLVALLDIRVLQLTLRHLHSIPGHPSKLVRFRQ